MANPSRPPEIEPHPSSSEVLVEDLVHLRSVSMGASLEEDGSGAPTIFQKKSDASSDSQQDERQLRAELDIVKLQLYAARDAVKGAEAERAAALGHVKDVEFKLHLAEVEINSLKAELEAERVQGASLRKMMARRTRDVVLRSLNRG